MTSFSQQAGFIFEWADKINKHNRDEMIASLRSVDGEHDK